MPVRFDVPSNTSDKPFVLPGSEKALLLAAIAIFAVASATLWPFNPFPRNGVAWLRDANGVRCEKRGVVVSVDPLTLRPDASDAFTIELFLRPANTAASRTILGFFTGDHSKQLLIRQYHDGLLVTHDARIEHDPTRTQKIDVDRVFRKNQAVCLAVASGQRGTSVYVDGRLTEVFPSFYISRRELSGTIVLGTSPVTYDPWQGELLGLALYEKQLRSDEARDHCRSWTRGDKSSDLEAAVARFSFSEGAGSGVRNEVVNEPPLRIPDHFSLPFKSFLSPVWTEFEPNARYVADLLVNVLGFVPLGVIVYAYLSWSRLPKQSFFGTVAFCAIFSCTIEILQYYIPRRGSGWTDVITNSLGAALGALLAQRWNWGRALLKRTKLIS